MVKQGQKHAEIQCPLTVWQQAAARMVYPNLEPAFYAPVLPANITKSMQPECHRSFGDHFRSHVDE